MTKRGTEENSQRIGHVWAVRFLVAVALVLGILVCLEMGARLITRSGHNPTLSRVLKDYNRLLRHGPEWIRFVPDETLSYRLRPGFRYVSPRTSGETIHNADGIRADSEITPRRADVLRVVCFGGSTTYGVGVEDNKDTYPAQLEIALAEAAKAAGWEGVEVFNLGVGGYTSLEIAGALSRMLPALEPDVVLIQNAINDVIPRFYPNFTADYSHFRTDFAPLELSSWQRLAIRSHVYVIVAHKVGWLKPLSLQSQTQLPMPDVPEALANLDQNPPTAFETRLRAIVGEAQSAGAKVWLLTQPYLDIPDFAAPDENSRKLEGGYRRGLAEHTEVVVRLAAEAEVGLVPLHESMPRQRFYFSDPIHMTEAGNRVKANKIAEVMANALPRGPREAD